mmetsp:Transcript_17994/g.22106  ORF Transcript_17994/g.22106 Transcript_17994/m.22106 type:complete len:251 (+) Transcript_17994:481-1233(+)
MGTRSLNLERQILNVFDNVKEPLLASNPDVAGFCRECGVAAEVIHDGCSGDTVCTQCGVVITAHKVVETVFGAGLGGYSNGSADSAKLDLLTGEKANNGGRTRKWYKFLMKRVANEIIDGLCNDDVVRSFAKILFEKYTDRLEIVRDREKVIEACVAAAESRIRRLARKGSSNLLQFKCKTCHAVFNCKKERRFHQCNDKNKKHKQSIRSANDNVAVATTTVSDVAPKSRIIECKRKSPIQVKVKKRIKL